MPATLTPAPYITAFDSTGFAIYRPDAPTVYLTWEDGHWVGACGPDAFYPGGLTEADIEDALTAVWNLLDATTPLPPVQCTGKPDLAHMSVDAPEEQGDLPVWYGDCPTCGYRTQVVGWNEADQEWPTHSYWDGSVVE